MNPIIGSNSLGALPVNYTPDFLNKAKGAFSNINLNSNVPIATQAQGNSNITAVGLTPKSYTPAAPAVKATQAATQPQAGVLQTAGIQPPASVGSVNFGVSPTNTVNSNHLTSVTQSDALTAYDRFVQDAMNGKTQPTPTDAYMQKVLEMSTYSPEEAQALQQYADVTSRINATKLAERRQIKALQENGTITQEQAKAFIEESGRVADAQLADQAVQQSAATLSLGVLGQLRGNNLQALQNISQFYNPQQIAPGSTLGNAQGQSFFQGAGASPQTIMAAAQNLKQNDQMTGNLHLTPMGTVDDNYYYQQAQQIYATQGGTLGGGTGASAGGAMGGGTGQLPQQLATYLGASGGQYVNEDKVPKAQQDLVKQLAAQNGVPYLTQEDLSKYKNIQVTQQNLAQLQQVTERILGSGLQGRTLGAAWNIVQDKLQLNTDISSFRVWRDTAVNTIQSLAGGSGSGFRLNQAEIDTATGNLPTITDNVETAKAKLGIINSLLSRWQNQILTGNPADTSKTGGTPGGTVVQTAAGAINTDW
jgi:hypothetical protein